MQVQDQLLRSSNSGTLKVKGSWGGELKTDWQAHLTASLFSIWQNHFQPVIHLFLLVAPSNTQQCTCQTFTLKISGQIKENQKQWAALKVQCGTFGDFERKRRHQVVTFYIAALAVPLPSLPLNYGGLRTLAWIPRPPPSSSLLVYLKTWALTLNMNDAVRQLDCPYQASLDRWWCKTAAKWEQDPCYMYILMRTFLCGGKLNYFYCTVNIHLNWCINGQHVKLLPI